MQRWSSSGALLVGGHWLDQLVGAIGWEAMIAAAEGAVMLVVRVLLLAEVHRRSR